MMNKRLLASATLLLAATASAQSSVQLYGVIDTAYSRVGGDIASVRGLSSGGGGSIGSKLGFKGEEPLGGGLSAGFDLEVGIESSSGGKGVPSSADNVALDGGGGFGFDRRATVSLKGGFGELRLGRDLAASFVNDVVYEPFLTYGVGSSLNFPLGAVADATNAASMFRVSNALSYFLPAGLGGWSGQLQVAIDEHPGSDAGRYTGARLGYDAGALSLAVSGGRARQSLAGLGNDRRALNAGAAWDFGAVRLLGEWARYETDNSGGIAGRDQRNTIVTLGVTAPLASGIAKAGYSHGRVRVDGIAGRPCADKLALGYEHTLSKRTALYATLAHLRNEGGAALNVGDGGVAGLAGARSSPDSASTGWDLGLRHAF